jgi:hypothetical protein
VTAGPPDTLINVSGSLFLPNTGVSLYWDQTNRVSGAVDTDAKGNFSWKVKPFPGDPPGLHKLCATSQTPNPCAGFTLQAAVVSPSPEASPSPEPSPSSTPLVAPPPAQTNSKLNPLDVILKPPFVILPIIGGVGVVIALMYWLLSILMRPRERVLKSVTVGHLASRPDYSASFGAPPIAPAPAEPMPSAWTDVAHTSVAPPSGATVEEAQLPSQPLSTYPEAGTAMTQGVIASSDEAPLADASTQATPAADWTGEAGGEPDPLLAAWSDVLPPRTGSVEAPPRADGEGTPKPETKPRAAHDDPLDFPEPGD